MWVRSIDLLHRGVNGSSQRFSQETGGTFPHKEQLARQTCTVYQTGRLRGPHTHQSRSRNRIAESDSTSWWIEKAHESANRDFFFAIKSTRGSREETDGRGERERPERLCAP